MHDSGSQVLVSLLGLFIGVLPFLFLFLIAGLALASMFFWIWMLVDCLTKEPSEGNDKVIWILILIFTHWLGALIYLLVRRPERRRLYGR